MLKEFQQNMSVQQADMFIEQYYALRKDPSTALLLSFLLGFMGVDRFYLGDIGAGLFKLVTFGGCGLVYVLDWLFIWNHTQKHNQALAQRIAIMDQSSSSDLQQSKSIKLQSYRHVVCRLDDGVQITLPSVKNSLSIVSKVSRIVALLSCSIAVFISLYLFQYCVAGSTNLRLIVPSDASHAYRLGVTSFITDLTILFFILVTIYFMILLIHVLYSFLWELGGKEVMVINKENLAISQHIFGWRTTFKCPLSTILCFSARPNSHIKEMRHLVLFGLPASLGLPVGLFINLSGRGGKILFRSSGKKNMPTFGIGISETEASEIVSIIQQYIILG